MTVEDFDIAIAFCGAAMGLADLVGWSSSDGGVALLDAGQPRMSIQATRR
jgi:hypothetical protein